MAEGSFFSKLREPVNGLTHFFAAIAAKLGLVVLIALSWGRLSDLISTTVYGVSLILLFGASAAYHLVKARPEVIAKLRKFDHAAIFLLIAGTYTPVCMALTGFWKWGLLSVIWVLAAIGILVKMFVMKAPRWLTAGVYLVMGWLCLAAMGEMLRVLPTGAIAWLVAGGLLYSFGAIVYITKAFNFIPNVFGFHEVWHIFVILAAASHYVAIAVYVVPVG
ncbi:MAG: hemolysin III family protein [bacterium]